MAAIAVMGGTFDPIHYAHLLIAEEARVQFSLKKVVFVTAGQPPHKKDYVVSDAEHRYAMAALATASNPFFECSRMEIERAGPSYTVDTIESLWTALGAATDLYLITGADAVGEVLTWHEPQRIVSMCRVIAAHRPGYDFEKLKSRLPKDIADKVIFLESPGVYVSSTELRSRIREGRSIKYMTPEPVEAYIREHALYKDVK